MRVGRLLHCLIPPHLLRGRDIHVLYRLIYHFLYEFADPLPVSHIQFIIFQRLPLANKLRLDVLLALPLHVRLSAVELINIEHFLSSTKINKILTILFYIFYN